MNNPYALVTVDDTHMIPGFMVDCIYYGLLARVQERLYMQGNDRMLNLAERSEAKYMAKRKEIAAKTYGFMDERSVPQAQPYRWLSEDYYGDV